MKKFSIVTKSILMCSLIACLTTGCMGQKPAQPGGETPQAPAGNIQQPAAPAANEMGQPAANKQGYVEDNTKRVAVTDTNNDLSMNKKAVKAN